MSMQEILRLLINSPSIDKNQLEIIKKSLLAKVRKYEELEYIDQVFLAKAYDASLKLMIIRLSDGQDQEPCKNLFDLVINTPSRNINEEWSQWIKENSLIKETKPADQSCRTSPSMKKLEKIKGEFEKLKKIASYVKFYKDNDEDPKRIKRLSRHVNYLPDLEVWQMNMKMTASDI